MDRPERGETRSPPASKARPVCEKSQLEVNRSLLRGKGAGERDARRWMSIRNDFSSSRHGQANGKTVDYTVI